MPLFVTCVFLIIITSTTGLFQTDELSIESSDRVNELMSNSELPNMKESVRFFVMMNEEPILEKRASRSNERIAFDAEFSKKSTLEKAIETPKYILRVLGELVEPVQEQISRNQILYTQKKTLEKVRKAESGLFTGMTAGETNGNIIQFTDLINAFSIDISDQETIDQFLSDDSVKTLIPVKYGNIELASSVPLLFGEESFPLEFPDIESLGEGATAGVIDTGIDFRNPAFGSCKRIGERGCAVIKGVNFEGEIDDPGDIIGHGTHVAGIIAGRNYGAGFHGMAPSASLINGRYLDFDDFIHFFLAQEDYVIKILERLVDERVHIISISLGVTVDRFNDEFDNPMAQAIERASEIGTLVVVAAGNSGPKKETLNLLSASPEALSVSAVNKDNKLVYFSSKGRIPLEGSYGIKPDVVAPGHFICSARSEGGIQRQNNCFNRRMVCEKLKVLACVNTPKQKFRKDGIFLFKGKTRVFGYPDEFRQIR